MGETWGDRTEGNVKKRNTGRKIAEVSEITELLLHVQGEGTKIRRISKH